MMRIGIGDLVEIVIERNLSAIGIAVLAGFDFFFRSANQLGINCDHFDARSRQKLIAIEATL